MNIKSILGGALVLGGLAAVVYAATTSEDEAMTTSTDPSLDNVETGSTETTPSQDTPTEQS